jgi:hypothetical protein
MNEDFDKLDRFMRTHRPAEVAGTATPRLPQRRWLWAGSAVAGLLIVAGLQWQQRQATQASAELAVQDAIEWDEFATGLPLEVGDMVTLAE